MFFILCGGSAKALKAFRFTFFKVKVLPIGYMKKKTPKSSYLPPFGAFLGELGEHDVFFGMLLLVLFATRLDKESVGRHTAPRLSVNLFRHSSFALR